MCRGKRKSPSVAEGVLSVMAWLHQLAMKPRDSCGSKDHCLKYSVFYCTVWTTEAELLAMFESP